MKKAFEKLVSAYELTWVGLVVLAWELGACSSSRSWVQFSPVAIWGDSLALKKNLCAVGLRLIVCSSSRS